MKSKYVIFASALLFSVGTIAQKDQIKAAEKALKGGNAAEAATILTQAEPSIAAASPAEKAQFYFVRGNALLDLANKKIEASKNLSAAASAYKNLMEVEKASGKSKYTAEAQAALDQVKASMINSAKTDGDNKNYKAAAATLYQLYDLDKTNLDNLYFSAIYYLNGQDYDTALNYFQDLKKQNYSGEGTNYYAKSAINDQEEYYGNTPPAKKDRDDKVRLKLATTPRDEKLPSKKAEIARYIALIYVQQNKTAEAKASLEEAKAINPDDVDLLAAEADIYLKMGDFVTYKKLVGKLLEKKPNDANLLYNIGVATTKTDPVMAEEYYKKAITAQPDYINAYLNLAILKLSDEKKIVDEMNKLGTSEKDNKRYEMLKKQRTDMFNAVLPYLEKANQLKPDNEDVANTLLNVYSALEMGEKKKALKAKMAK